VVKNQSNAQGVRAKIKFFENFLTPFLTSSYENRALRIEDLFQSNAQVRPNYGGRGKALGPADPVKKFSLS